MQLSELLSLDKKVAIVTGGATKNLGSAICECLAEAGADLVIFGDVTQYDAQQDYAHVAVAIVSGGGTKYTHRVGLSIRAVSVDDGRVIYARSGQGADPEGYTKAAEIAAEKAIRPLRQFYRQKRGQ